MRILLSCVGEQDPRSGQTQEWGSLVTLYQYLQERDLRPERIYLFPSSQETTPNRHTEQHARDSQAELEQRGFSREAVIIRPLRVENAADQRQALPEMRCVLGQVLAETAALEPAFEINHSSGTPQMKACWPFLLSTGFLTGRLWQVYDPRGAKSPAPADRVREMSQELEVLEEERILVRVRQMVANHVYGQAGHELEELSQRTGDEARRQAAAALQKLCLVYHLWDVRQFSAARRELGTLLVQHTARFSTTAQDLLRRQRETLDLLKRDAHGALTDPGFDATLYPSHTLHLIADYYHNARRRHQEENYADTLTRAHTIRELCLNHRLRMVHHVEASDLRVSQYQALSPGDQQSAREAVRQLAGLYTRPEWGLDTSVALRALEEVLSDAEARCFLHRPAGLAHRDANWTMSSALEWMRRLRNAEEHQGRPVEKQDAEDALWVARQLIRFVFRGLPDLSRERDVERFIDDYCFASEAVQPILEESLRSC
jgi:hypothetical protein